MAHVQTDVFHEVAAEPVETIHHPSRGAKSLIGQIGWLMLDSSRSPYSALVALFVFAPYFTTVVIRDPVEGQAVWSDITAIAAIVLALTAPLMGAIADAGGRRKPWIAACIIFGAPCMALLWLAKPDMDHGLFWVGAALVGGQLAFEFSAIFANAMLPDVAPPERVGVLSGYGFAACNVASFTVMVFFMLAWSMNPHPLFGVDVAASEPQRLVGPMAGLWFVVFGVPFFFLTPDVASVAKPKLQVVREGMRNLAHTIGRLKHHRNAALFLLARMVFNEGFIVLILFTGIFAAGVLKWTPTMLVISGVTNSVFATLGGIAASWLDRKIGCKGATIVFVVASTIANIFLCTLGPDSVLFIKVAMPIGPHGMFASLPDQAFFAASVAMAFFVTAGFAASRTMMARLSPPTMLAEFFGLYALSGTATSFLGPLAIGALTRIFDSQRAGVGVGVFFFLAGLAILTRVKAPAE